MRAALADLVARAAAFIFLALLALLVDDWEAA